MKTKILLLALLSACSLSPATALASETVPQTQTALRSYFQTGHVPTQTNYWELIDTMFWYVASTYTNSLVTASNAAAELAVSPVAARVTGASSTSRSWTPAVAGGFALGRFPC